MPGFDATGPKGMGPGTGWGRGQCGAGLRRGINRGRTQGSGNSTGWRHPLMGPWGSFRWGQGPWWFGSGGAGKKINFGSPLDEATALSEEVSYLKEKIEAIQKRLAELIAPMP